MKKDRKKWREVMGFGGSSLVGGAASANAQNTKVMHYLFGKRRLVH